MLMKQQPPTANPAREFFFTLLRPQDL